MTNKRYWVRRLVVLVQADGTEVYWPENSFSGFASSIGEARAILQREEKFLADVLKLTVYSAYNNGWTSKTVPALAIRSLSRNHWLRAMLAFVGHSKPDENGATLRYTVKVKALY